MSSTSSNIPVLRIKREAELDRNFAKTIAKLAHGEQIYGCIQCGNCSSSCPLSPYMDYTPRKIIAMVKAGFREEVLTNKTIWLCASCYACTVECPKGIKITDVMYALKREAIQNKIYPKRFTIPAMSKAFYDTVKNTGRSNEVALLMRYYMRTNIFSALSYVGVGLKLLKTGRLAIIEKQMKRKQDFKKMLKDSEN
ncbi:MAG: 4Fe-4S dicluster domain-containing protein [Bacteroidota bacterium]